MSEKIRNLREALAKDPGNVPAFKMLEEMFFLEGRFGELTDLYENQSLAQSLPAAVRAEYLFKAGRLFETKMQDLTQAERSWKRAVALAPAHLTSLENLFRIYRLKKQPALALQIGELLEAVVRDKPNERLKLLREMFNLYVVDLDSPEHALDLAEQILEVSPQDPAVLEILRNHLASPPVWSRLEKKYDEWQGKAREPKKQKTYRLQRAKLLALELQRFDEAADILKPLVQDPGDFGAEALALLGECYVQMGKPSAAVELLVQAASQFADRDQKAMLFERAAGLLSGDPQSESRALALWRKVLELMPGNDQAAFALASWFRRERNWRELVEVLARHTASVDQPGQGVAAFLEMGEVYHDYLKQPDKAIRCFERVLQAEGENVKALLSLIELYDTKGDAERAAIVRRKVARLIETRPEAEIGLDLYEAKRARQLRKLPEALDRYRKVLGHDPRQEEALRLLPQVLQELGQWEDLAAFYESRIETADAKTQTDLLWKVAIIYRDRLHDEGGAVVALRKLLKVARDHLQAFAVLEKIYRDRKNWGDLLHLLIQRVEGETESGSRFALFVEIAGLWEREFTDLEKSYQALLAAHAENLESAPVLGDLARIAFTLGRLAEAIDWLKKALALPSLVPEAKKANHERIIEVYRALPNTDAEDLIPHWQAILEVEPANAAALSGLEEIFATTGRRREHVELLQRALPHVVTPDLRVSLYSRLGGLLEQDPAHRAEAIEAWESARKLDPGNLEALRALVRGYDALNREPQLAEALRLLIAELKRCGLDEEWLVNLKELAIHLEQKLSDPAGALDAWDEWLRVNRDRGRARHAGLLAVERLSAKLENWDQHLQALLERKGEAESSEERRAVTNRLAEVYIDRLGRVDEGLELFRDSLADEIDQPDIQGRLFSLYSTRQDWRSLASLLEDILARATLTPLERQKRQLDLARLWVKEPERLEAALRLFETVLQTDPENIEVRLELADLAKTHGRIDDEFSLLQQVVDIFAKRGDADGLAESRRRILALAERTERFADGAGAARDLLDSGTIDEAAFRVLKEDARERRDFSELDHWLSRHLEAASDDDTRKALLVERGELARTTLETPDEAARIFEAILRLDTPSINQADASWVNWLVDRSKGAQEWETFAQAAKWLSSLQEESGVALAERIQLLMERGEIERDACHNAERSIEAYRGAVDLALKAPQAIEPLELRQRLLEPLETLYRAGNHAEALAGLYEIWLAVEKQGLLRQQLGLKLAETVESRLGNPERAAHEYRKVFEADPLHPEAFQQLERLYRQLGAAKSLIEVYERRAEELTDLSEVARLQIRAGLLWEEQLGDQLEASLCYQKAVELAPRDQIDRPILERLEKIYRQQGQWKKLVRLLQQKVEIAGDATARAAVWLELAAVCEDFLEDHNQAVSAYESVLRENPASETALRALARLAIENGRPEKAADYLRRLIQHLKAAEGGGNNPEIVQFLERLGELQQDELTRPEEAIATFEEVVARDPKHVEALKHLRRLYQTLGRWENLAEVYGRIEGLVTSPSERITILEHQAEVFAKELRDVDRALAVYRTILSVDPQQVTARSKLAELLAVEGRWREKVDEDVRSLGTLEDEKVIRDTLLRIVETLRVKLDAGEEALPYAWRLAEEFRDQPTVDVLIEELVRQERWNDLAEAFRLKLDFPLAREIDWETRLSLAEVLARHLANDAEAVELLETLLTEIGKHAEAERPRPVIWRAVAVLTPIYERLQRAERLTELYELGANTAPSDLQAVECLARLGEIRLESGRTPESAREAFMAALARLPADGGATALEIRIRTAILKLLDPTADRAEVRDQLRKLVLCASDSLPWRLELADSLLQADEADEAAAREALEQLEEVILQRPLELRVRHLLNAALYRLGLWSRWLDSARAEMVLEPDAATKAALLERMGAVLLAKLKEPQAGAAALEEALVVYPRQFTARRLLADFHRSEGRIEAGLAVLLDGLGVEEDTGTLQDLLVEAARVAQHDLRDLVRAREYLKRSLLMSPPQSPHRETCRVFLDLAFSEGGTIDDDPALLHLYQAYADRYGDEEGAEFFARYAQALLPKREYAERRIELLSRAVALDPAHRQANRLLGLELFDRENWLEALAVWRRLFSSDALDDETVDREILEKFLEAALRVERLELLLPMTRRLMDLDIIRGPAIDVLVRRSDELLRLNEKRTVFTEILRETLARDAWREMLSPATRSGAAYLLAKPLAEPGLAAVELVRRFRIASEGAPEGSRLQLDALLELSRLFLGLGQKHQAIKTAEAVLEKLALDSRPESSGLPTTLVPALPDESELHLRLSEWLEGLDNQRAGTHLWDYLKKQPGDRPAFEKLRRWLLEWRDFERLDALLTLQLEQLTRPGEADSRENRLALLRDLGTLRLRELRQPERARPLFEQLRSEDPEDGEVHLALAGIYDAAPAFRDRAIDEHEWLLQKDPLRLGSYRALLRHAREQGDDVRAEHVAFLLFLLGDAHDEEIRLAERLQERRPVLRPGTLSPDARERYLVHPRHKEYLRDLFWRLQPGLERMYMFRPEKYGLTKSDRIGKHSPNEVLAIAHRADHILRAFGGDEFAFYWDRQAQNRFLLEQDKKPTLVLSSDFLPLVPEVEQNFLFGRASQYVLDGTVILQKAKPDKLEKTLEALLQLLEVKKAEQLLEADDLENTARTVSKLGRRVRREIRPLVEQHADPARRISFQAWLEAVHATANRGALLACGSLRTTIDFLTKEEKLDPKEGPSVIRRQLREGKPLRDLFVYAASSNFFALRKLMFDDEETVA